MSETNTWPEAFIHASERERGKGNVLLAALLSAAGSMLRATLNALTDAESALATERAAHEETKRERDAMKARAEHAEVQLAGCGVAAMGGSSIEQQAPPGSYGYSASYADVLRLRHEVDAMRPVVEAAERWRDKRPSVTEKEAADLCLAVDAYRSPPRQTGEPEISGQQLGRPVEENPAPTPGACSEMDGYAQQPARATAGNVAKPHRDPRSAPASRTHTAGLSSEPRESDGEGKAGREVIPARESQMARVNVDAEGLADLKLLADTAWARCAGQVLTVPRGFEAAAERLVVVRFLRFCGGGKDAVELTDLGAIQVEQLCWSGLL